MGSKTAKRSIWRLSSFTFATCVQLILSTAQGNLSHPNYPYCKHSLTLKNTPVLFPSGSATLVELGHLNLADTPATAWFSGGCHGPLGDSRECGGHSFPGGARRLG